MRFASGDTLLQVPISDADILLNAGHDHRFSGHFREDAYLDVSFVGAELLLS